MSDVREWLLVKRDLYYRPGSAGYTGIRDYAGRYTEAEAQSHVGNGDSGVSMVRETDAAEYTPACFSDLREAHSRAKEQGRGLDPDMDETLSTLQPLIAFRNARRICKREYQRSPNWVLAMELFGLGSTYAYGFCRRHGIDPESRRTKP